MLKGAQFFEHSFSGSRRNGTVPALSQRARRAVAPRIVLVGAACQARDANDPFNHDERAAMIAATPSAEERA
jgi:hypothetical protein